jgi:hypothetical protein
VLILGVVVLTAVYWLNLIAAGETTRQFWNKFDVMPVVVVVGVEAVVEALDEEDAIELVTAAVLVEGVINEVVFEKSPCNLFSQY